MNPQHDAIARAVEQLGKSDRGRLIRRALFDLIDGPFASADFHNRDAAVVLLMACESQLPDVLGLLRDAERGGE